MARFFVAPNDHAEYDGNVAGSGYTFPLTLACWIWGTQDSTYRTYMSLGTTDVQPDQISLSKNTSNNLTAVVYGTNWAIHTYGTVPNQQWTHVAGVFTSNVHRLAYINGATGNPNTQNQTPSNLNKTTLAVNYYNGSPTANAFHGAIARAAIWKSALTADQIKMLANNAWPYDVDIANLVGYWELAGDFSPEPDWSGNVYNMTLIDSPLYRAHPPNLRMFPSHPPLLQSFLYANDDLAFGQETTGSGEIPVKWSEWSDGAGGLPTITSGSDWGKLYLIPGEEARSPVYVFGDADSRKYTLEPNVYGTGSQGETIQIRGSTTPFSQDDSSPTWETYTAQITRSWKYVQVRVVA